MFGKSRQLPQSCLAGYSFSMHILYHFFSLLAIGLTLYFAVGLIRILFKDENRAVVFGQVKRYQATIDYLTQENDALKEKVKAQNSLKRQLESAKRKQENERLWQFVQRIPPEVRQARKEQQQSRR